MQGISTPLRQPSPLLYSMGWTLLWVITLFLPSSIRAEEIQGNVYGELISPSQMQDSFEGALEGHRTELLELGARLKQLQTLKVQIESDIRNQNYQSITHNRLLLKSDPQMVELEYALKNNRLASKTLTERIMFLQKGFELTLPLFAQDDDRIELARKQMSAVNQFQLSDAQKQKLQTTTQELIQVLDRKRRVGREYRQEHQDILERLSAVLNETQTTGKNLADRLASLKKTSLIRRAGPYRQVYSKALPEAVDLFWNRLSGVLAPEMWKTQLGYIKIRSVGHWAVLVVFLGVLVVLQGRGRTALRRLEAKSAGSDYDFLHLALTLLRRSLPYLGLTLVFGIYDAYQLPLLDIGLDRVLFNIFLFLLLTRWGLDFLRYGLTPSSARRRFMLRHLSRFLRIFRTAIIVVILLMWAAGKDNMLSYLARDILAAVLFVWALAFWRRIKAIEVEAVQQDRTDAGSFWSGIVRWWMYGFSGGTLLLNLAGYVNMADYWFIAWVKSLAIFFWWWISLNVIREWHRGYQAGAVENDEPSSGHSGDFHWPLLQLARLTWFAGLAVGLMWAWDKSGILYARLWDFLSLNPSIGSLQFSVKGLILAVLILFVTYLLVQFGRTLVSQKVLQKRALDQGLKDSVLTLASYMAWGIGLMVALGVVGVNATSLAVIFGALSVGIGFGLQNIFNNFISGLILLFERPIKVGDIVEIKGLWAEVKKINVRATVVQTFDNSSVIIPNSEFISQQVTNWSFRDQRMRSNLEVGVAYGSDVDLVKTTLMEIAWDHPQVLKYPRPEVLFMDHGDSALIFRLRFWLHINDYWTVPSEIRGGIDRRFRELAIEIAFPQRDLHIRTVSEKIPGAVEPGGGEKPASSPAQMVHDSPAVD